MPASPVHHTKIDKTSAWDGPAAEKSFDKEAGDFVKFYAWVDEGESDPDADGTDKEDGWGPHHDVDSDGIPGAANLKGFEAAMGALNGAHGGNSVIPDGDRQDVWDHLAAHYRDAGVKDEDIPALRSAHLGGGRRSYDPVPGEIGDGDNDADDEGTIPGTDPPEEREDPEDPTNAQAAGATPGGGDAPEMPSGTGAASAGDGSPTCATCGRENASDAEYCSGCGAFLGNDPLPPEDMADDDMPNVDEYDPARSAPTESLIRFRRSGPAAPSVLLRDEAAPTQGSSGSLMFGYFSTFNEWYEIDSWFEGQFLERVAPGTYTETMTADRPSMRVLYDHGFDPQLGNKPLGPITELKEDGVGAYYEVPLLDTDYNRNFLLPALRGQLMNGQSVGSLLGASFRFIVTGEEWDRTGKQTPDNPLGLPLRTITSAQVLEFGPVTFPANEGATAGVRSATDSFVERLRRDPVALARFTERSSAKVVERIFASAASRRGAGRNKPKPAGPDGTTVRTRNQRRAAVALLDLERS